MKPVRPVLRWHGGKWLLAPWVIEHFPRHRVYVEPFGGAASVLLRKPRAYAEIYNDLDDDAVNLFRVLQDPVGARALTERLLVTPFARAEYEIAWDETSDPIEQARRLVIRSFMGFGSHAHADLSKGHKTTGFRASSSRSGTTPAHDWANYPAALGAVVERLRSVVIERRPAMMVMDAHDGPDTLHYVDPPYLPETRNRRNPHDPKHQYRHELSVADHVELLEFLGGAIGNGGALGISVPTLRRCIARLATYRARGSGRWRQAADGSAVDQSCLRWSSSSRRHQRAIGA